MTQKAIGPTFPAELQAAGVLELQFSWDMDGNIYFGESITEEQKTAIEAVYAAHDPSKQLA